jgi:hypothetical protein
MRNFIFALLALCLLLAAGPACAQTTTYEHELIWQDNSDNEDGFKIERKTPSIPGDTFGEINQVAANVTTYTDSVTDGQQRCYRVRAFNATGNSAYTNEACGLPVPKDPLSLTITVTIKITSP